jgi:6-pyruvoyltetrahydropterin/6-carboxytetrahydropterin synthase
VTENRTARTLARTTELLVEIEFNAAHQLLWHQGACRNLHGHTYRAEITVRGDLDENGVIMDFADVKALIARSVVDDYDHTFLNEILDNPTAEQVAHDIADRLLAADLNLVEIRLWETRTCSVRVRIGSDE